MPEVLQIARVVLEIFHQYQNLDFVLPLATAEDSVQTNQKKITSVSRKRIGHSSSACVCMSGNMYYPNMYIYAKLLEFIHL